MVSVTSMLPRVAFEYGHTMWAASTSFCAVSRSRPGSEIFSSTSMPKPVRDQSPGVQAESRIRQVQIILGVGWQLFELSATRRF